MQFNFYVGVNKQIKNIYKKQQQPNVYSTLFLYLQINKHTHTHNHALPANVALQFERKKIIVGYTLNGYMPLNHAY